MSSERDKKDYMLYNSIYMKCLEQRESRLADIWVEEKEEMMREEWKGPADGYKVRSFFLILFFFLSFCHSFSLRKEMLRRVCWQIQSFFLFLSFGSTCRYMEGPGPGIKSKQHYILNPQRQARDGSHTSAEKTLDP